jgi:hypothetical protein
MKKNFREVMMKRIATVVLLAIVVAGAMVLVGMGEAFDMQQIRNPAVGSNAQAQMKKYDPSKLQRRDTSKVPAMKLGVKNFPPKIQWDPMAGPKPVSLKFTFGAVQSIMTPTSPSVPGAAHVGPQGDVHYYDSVFQVRCPLTTKSADVRYESEMRPSGTGYLTFQGTEKTDHVLVRQSFFEMVLATKSWLAKTCQKNFGTMKRFYLPVTFEAVCKDKDNTVVSRGKQTLKFPMLSVLCGE